MVGVCLERQIYIVSGVCQERQIYVVSEGI